MCVMFRDNKVSPRSDSDHGPSQQSPSPSRKQNGTSSSLSSKSVMNIQIESEESSSLLSKLDNKHIKEEFSSPAVFLGACFCPCLFLGHLDSKVKREDSFFSCCSTSCPRFSFGKTGCMTCCMTGLFCSLGWPCSPCLTCYLNSRSSSISSIYDRKVESKCCDFNFMWPRTVLQHILLYEQLEKEGRLFYDWTLNADVQQSFKRNQFEMTDSAILLVGGKHVGKTELLIKLCHRNLYEKRENTFEHNEVRVGFRPMSVTNTHVSSLEFWDIPTLHLQSIHTIRAKVTHVLLVFNVNKIETFHELKKIFKDVKEMSAIVDNAEFVVVAAHNDHLYYTTTAEGRWEVDPNQETILKASAWATENNLKMVSTATPFNIGVNDILKLVQQPPVMKPDDTTS